jgi:3-deoxy-D-manno-octulosonic-acid transferase
LHAVSVGEVLSCVELLRSLREELPHTPLYVSCGTLGGREAAEAKLSNLADGIFYAPLDFVFAVRGALRAVRPSVVLILETEIWPNLYREAKRAGAAVLVVNGRISDKAAPRYAQRRWFFSAALQHVDQILTQTANDQRRYVEAGAPAERVRVGGNLKYDFQASTARVPAAVLPLLTKPLWIAASTTGPMRDGDVDEDDAVLAAFSELRGEFPTLQLLVAPRRPERFEVVASKLRNKGISFLRRSQGEPSGEPTAVILLDSVGELGALFAYADVVFMGGTLAERGGHNILEPALCGKPVVAGPHMQNFAAIRDRFLAAHGYVEIDTPTELAPAVRMLLADVGLSESLGARARALAESERGATLRAVRLVAAYRWLFVPRAMPWGWAAPIMRLLGFLWTSGGAWKRAMTKPRSLSTSVVSIGGLAMGGVGKTPTTACIADALRARGYKPAILTRGYGRASSETVCLPRGADAPVSVTGDEAQLLLRSADVGIGSDRWNAGLEVEKQFSPDLFLLDDGFQHARLGRDVDIVLLDAMDPFAGDAVFPKGRLREPLAALERADIILITRAGRRRFDGLLPRLPKKPTFFADVEISSWIPEHPASRPVAAFCGLANPHAFFETLQDAAVRVVTTSVFADHHRYTPDEMKQIAQSAFSAGATVLVTTEKDRVNLPVNCDELVRPLRIITVAIRTKLRNEREFLSTIEDLLGWTSRAIDGHARG